jgi:preprotein translocase subunit SecD
MPAAGSGGDLYHPAPMRRAAPIFIIVIAVLAIVIDFVALPLPGNDGTTRRLETKLGLDLRGGLRIEYQVLPAEGKAPTRDDLNVMRQIIVNRIDKSGVAEPQVVVQGTDRIIVELPGVQNPDQIRDLVGTTGRLDFVPLGQTQMAQDQEVAPEVLATKCDDTTTEMCVLFSGDQVAAAQIGANQTGQRTVNFTLTGDGKDRFANYTADHIGDYFAIVLDGKVITAPVIQSSIPNGQVEIQSGGIGGYPLAEAQNLVTILQFGQLPFPIAELANTTVSPTLGDAFLQQSVLAGIIAILMVVFFMVVHYRMPGVVASIALVIYALLVYALFRLIPVTLTLAGVAGFVLSVGMAVDANILIFERMKEELRVGKILPAAIEAGFNRAWNSILDSNVSSLITAMILFLFGTSTIRGFGLVLIVGVLVSMFTAVTVTRTIMRVVVAQPWARKASLYGVTEEEFLARPSGRPVRGEARSRV